MKEWKSLDEQIAILESRDMSIGDHSKAKEILQRVGYYRFSGYSYPFRKTNNGILTDQFVDGTNISDVFDLYVFDKKLKILCLDAIERIEIALRVDIANALGRDDPKAHIQAHYFNESEANKLMANHRTNFELWLHDYERRKIRARHSRIVKHHIKEYEELPVWVATEILDLSSLVRLFRMMKFKQRRTIATKYGLSKPLHFEQWLRALYKVRNISTHHERLWNAEIIGSQPMPPQLYDHDLTDVASTKNNRIFRHLCIMQLLLLTISPNSTWGRRLKVHLESFPAPKNEMVAIESLGVVDKWDEWNFWKPKNEVAVQENYSFSHLFDVFKRL